MSELEVVLNLWYVRDEEGIIYSLRLKPYVCSGTDEEKLQFLKQRARLDYLIAEPFAVPDRFHVLIEEDNHRERMPVGHVTMLQSLKSPIALFEDVIKVIEDRFPAQSEIGISEDPLICTTPLMQNTHGVIEPRIEGEVRY